MDQLDLLLRGAALGLFSLCCTLLWATGTPWRKALSLTFLCVTMIGYTFGSSDTLNLGAWGSVAIFGAKLAPLALTWVVLELFFDRFRDRWPWLAYAGVTAGFGVLSGFDPSLLKVCASMVFFLYLGLLGLALLTDGDDLVESRRRFRRGFVAAMTIVGVTISIIELEFVANPPAWLLVTQIMSINGLAIAFILWAFTLKTDLWPPQTVVSANVNVPRFDTVLARLKAEMSAGAWQEEGLTIGALAERIDVPEHRLRAAINQGMGYRNFSSFINRHRIEAAQTALKDPDQSEKTILQIAYESGFGSLGPFNRAFRAQTGTNPRDFRRAA
jgi:AraC-like DNA-binding protein